MANWKEQERPQQSEYLMDKKNGEKGGKMENKKTSSSLGLAQGKEP